jgi:hypothetical protein
MKKKSHKQKEIKEGKPNKASFHPGSTVQGGSNFGQGSLDLGRYSNKQGSELNDGSNYENEKGWNNEALRTDEE